MAIEAQRHSAGVALEPATVPPCSSSACGPRPPAAPPHRRPERARHPVEHRGRRPRHRGDAQARLGRLVARMLVAQLVEYAVEMPFSPDHWALVSLVNCPSSYHARPRSTSLETVARAFPAAASPAHRLRRRGPVEVEHHVPRPRHELREHDRADDLLRVGRPARRHHLFNYGTLVTETPGLPAAHDSTDAQLGRAARSRLPLQPQRQSGHRRRGLHLDGLRALLPLPAPRGHRPRPRPDVILGGALGIVRDARRRPRVTAFLAFVFLGFGGHVVGPVPVATVYVLRAVLLRALPGRHGPGASRAASGKDARRQAPSGAGAPRARAGPPAHPRVGPQPLPRAAHDRHRTRCSPTCAPSPRTPTTCSCRRSADGLAGRHGGPDVVHRRRAPGGCRQRPGRPAGRAAQDRHGPTRSWRSPGSWTVETVTFGPQEGQTELEPLPAWQYRLFLLRPVPTDGRAVLPAGLTETSTTTPRRSGLIRPRASRRRHRCARRRPRRRRAGWTSP